MVSEYYSYGWTHLNSATGKHEGLDLGIRNMTVDQYALNRVPHLRGVFGVLLDTIENSCCNISDPGCTYRCIFASYEESMTSYATWSEKIAKAVSCDAEFIAVTKSILHQKNINIPQDILSKTTEANVGHVRSGVPGNYVQHLSRSTIDELHEKFADILHILKSHTAQVDVAGLYALPSTTSWSRRYL